MICPFCKEEIADGAIKCKHCGSMLVSIPAAGNAGNVSDKSLAAAAILCFFFGFFGVHRFYAGKVGSGIAMVFTLGGFGIWVFADFISILAGSFKDIENKLIKPKRHRNI